MSFSDNDDDDDEMLMEVEAEVSHFNVNFDKNLSESKYCLGVKKRVSLHFITLETKFSHCVCIYHFARPPC
jgi:hypothetical protein